MLNPTSPYDDEDAAVPALPGSIGGDDGIGGAVGYASNEGMMLVRGARHGPGFINFNRTCLTEGAKNAAQGKARKRKAPGEKCKCGICKTMYQFRFVTDKAIAELNYWVKTHAHVWPHHHSAALSCSCGTAPPVGPLCRRNLIPRRPDLDQNHTGLPAPNPKATPALLGGWMR